MDAFATVEAHGLAAADCYRLVTSCVVPRPIAWITTCDGRGRVNLAPFSSFNYVAHSPPMLAVNIASRDGQLKDTARNIRETKEFVVNMPDEALLDLVHLTSAEHPMGVSEAEAHGIELIAGQFVAVPRVASAPIHMECRLNRVLALGNQVNTLYIADIVAFHLNKSIFDGRRIDIEAYRPILRLAGPHYAGLGRIYRREPLFQPSTGVAGAAS